MTTIVVPAAAARLVEVARQVLTRADVPYSALIGGLAVTIRVAAPDLPYRATADIDVVTEDAEPTLVEVITGSDQPGQALSIDGVTVDVIATAPVSEDDLVGIDEGPRLFLVAHRWALETAESVTLTTSSGSMPPFAGRVATPAGLVAAKAHALGFARSQRRSTKHGSDLLDVYRLVELHGGDGSLAGAIRTAPGGIAGIIAAAIRRTILVNPAKAAMLMSVPGTGAADADVIEDVMSDFVTDLG